MKKAVVRVRTRVAIVTALALAIVMLVPGLALATTPSTDPVKTAVTPYFNDLKGFATDLVPFALGVIAIGVAFGLAMRWFKRSKA